MSELKQLIDDTGAFDCVECGKCTSVCPVARVDPEFAPRLIVVKALEGVETNIQEEKDIWSCVTCEMCNDMCPYEVDYSGFILGMRNLAAEAGNIPVFSKAGAVHTMQRMTGMGQKQNRLRWLTPDLKVSDKGEVFYFTGCAYHLGTLYQDKAEELRRTPASVVKIMNAAGVVPAISNDEVCCGHDLLWAGDEESFLRLMDRNVETIRQSGAKTVVFSCPEGMRTFEIDYQDFLGEFDFEIKHISEFILDLVEEGRLQLGEAEAVVTYHDSCRLGRHLGIYDEPRGILEEMGAELVEMANTMEKASCCGVNAFTNCSEISKKLQIERLKEAKETGAEVMLTFCPKCIIHYNCLLEMRKLPIDRDQIEIKVRDFSNFIAEHLK